MGMLRCFAYTKDGNNIVLYSTTPEFCKVIYQALKLNMDARHEKDILPSLEIVKRAAASIVTNELMKSPYLKEFDFMSAYQNKENVKIIFSNRITHEINEKIYMTIVEPIFTRVDLKRFIESECHKYLKEKVVALKGYLEQLKKKKIWYRLLLFVRILRISSRRVPGYVPFSQKIYFYMYITFLKAL